MRDRFDELEEQLKQLETIPLVPAGAKDDGAGSEEPASVTEDSLVLNLFPSLISEGEDHAPVAGNRVQTERSEDIRLVDDNGSLRSRFQTPQAGGEGRPPLVSTRVPREGSEEAHSNGKDRPLQRMFQIQQTETKDRTLLAGYDGETDPTFEPPSAPKPAGWLASAISDLSAWKWRSRVRALEDEAISECQERMRQALGEVIKDAQRQLEGLANQLVPSLQMRMEQLSGKSAGSLAGQLPQPLEQQIRATTQPGITLAAEAAREAAYERRETHQAVEARPALDSEEVHKKLMHAFTPVAEDIQLKTAAFLEHLNLQVHNTLRAFGEKATKHAAEEFQKIAVEVLQREAGYAPTPQRERRSPGGNPQDPRESARAKPEKFGAEGVKMAQPKAAPEERKDLAQIYHRRAGLESEPAGTQPRSTEKGTDTSPKWRILGLG